MIDRRVILSGALAGLATSACSSSVSEQVASSSSTPIDPNEPNESDLSDVNVVITENTDFGTPATDAGSLADFCDEADLNNGFVYRPRLRAWLVPYPEEFVERAKKVYPKAMHEGLEAGVLVLHQKCPHLGCRVPECGSSGQFECPCHGSMYSPVGEHLGGPSPRGMDMFATQIIDGRIIVDTSQFYEGMPIGTDVTGFTPTGPTCLGEHSTTGSG